jgi:hypothetical protein
MCCKKINYKEDFDGEMFVNNGDIKLVLTSLMLPAFESTCFKT